jgi:hypothetical protein
VFVFVKLGVNVRNGAMYLSVDEPTALAIDALAKLAALPLVKL